MIAQPADEETVTDLLAVSQPLMVCRLCESKHGPFLNIFEDDNKVTAKKIEELMPFSVAPNDDLPHKVCFRCSAKVEETYQFMQKCIKTQINLRTGLGKKELFEPELNISKSVWEELLNNLTRTFHLVSDAGMKKVMEGIKDIPINLQNNSENAEKPDLNSNKLGNDTTKKKTSEISKMFEKSTETIYNESDGDADDESEQIKFAAVNVSNCQLPKKPKITKKRSSVTALNVSNGGQLPNKPEITKRRSSVTALNERNGGQLPNKPKITKRRSSVTALNERNGGQLPNKPKITKRRASVTALNVSYGGQLPNKPKITKRRASVTALNESNGWHLHIKPKTTAKRASDAPSITTNKKIKVFGVEKYEKVFNNASKKPIERTREQDSLWKEQVSKIKNINTTQSNQKNSDQSTPKANAMPTINEKPFDIMDHVSIIKVNGVGDLFLCKLCNRDFWKIDVVQSHKCAKNRQCAKSVPKEDIVRKIKPPEPPKPLTVNTKLGNDSKNFAIPETSNSSDKTDADLRSQKTKTEGNLTKSKPRIGRARKVKRNTKKSPSGKKQNKMSEDNKDVIVKWKDGGQNCVRVRELRIVKRGDQIDKIGTEVKMYFRRQWFFGTVIMTERDDRKPP